MSIYHYLTMSISMASGSSTTLTNQQESPVPQSGSPYYGHTPSVTPRRHTIIAPIDQQQQSNTTSNDNDTQGNSQAKEEEEWLVACRCESGKSLLTLLSCLQHVAEGPSDQVGGGGVSSSNAVTQATTTANSCRNQKKARNTIQPVTIFCTPSGLTCHVFGKAKQSEASVELQKSMFSQYQVAEQPADTDDNNNTWRSGGEFCVNLCTVLTSLQLLGPLDRVSVGLSYNQNDEILKIELLSDGIGGEGESGVLCTSAIPGLNSPADDPEGDSLSSAFRSAPIAARIMVRSAILKELLPEWSSVVGASSATVAVSKARGLELVVLGHYGECWVQVPPLGDHLLSPLELLDPKKTVTRTYPLHSLLASFAGLDIAEESVININTEGLLAIQHKTLDPIDEGSSNFLDFIMTCLEDEDEEDEQNGEETATQTSATATAESHDRGWNKNVPSQSQTQSRETSTTTAEARRHRRRREKNPSQHDDDDDEDDEEGGETAMSNETDDNIQASDTDGEADSPSQRQQRQSLEKRRNKSLNFNNSNGECGDEEDPEPLSAVAPLFGVVVREQNDDDNETATSPRRRRRRNSSSRGAQRQEKRGKTRSKSRDGRRRRSNDDDDSSDGSGNNLLEESSDVENAGSSDEEALDITAFASRTPTRQSRDGGCSSPELVYGEQY